MKKHCCLLLLINLLSTTLLGQYNYYASDSTMITGITLIDGGDFLNSRFCQVKKGENILRYSPFEIEEYGFKDGRVYVSKEIYIFDSTHRVFLERLVIGKTNLYSYKDQRLKTYFLEKDSTLFIELPKYDSNNIIDFNNNLLQITSDCENVSDAIKLVHYNKKSLSTLISLYNECELKPFPFIRYGINIGLGKTNLVQNISITNELFRRGHFNNDYNISFGIFGDFPICQSDFSFHSEINYQKAGFSSHVQIDSIITDLVVNTTSFSIPVLIRYTFPKMKFRFFGNVGFLYSNNFRNNNVVYQSVITENIIEINQSKDWVITSPHQFGYSIGGGFQYKIRFRNFLFIELRFTSLFSTLENVLGINKIQLLTGLNF